MKNIWIALILFFVLQACNNNKTTKEQSSWQSDSLAMSEKYSPALYKLDSGALIDTLLPFFAKLHDSIPFAKRFDTVYRHFMNVHKVERDYKLLYFTKAKDGYNYIMISRLEPSIKSDKYSSLCARYKNNINGAIDTSSFEEVFWTWKMKWPELMKKSALLFRTLIEKGSVEAYLPENSEEEYIMFPDVNSHYDVIDKTWKPRAVKN